MNLKNIILGSALALSTACFPFVNTGAVRFHPLEKGCIEGLPVEVSYNDDESWRIIQIRSPDGQYVYAEDYAIDNDGKFDVYGHSGDIALNHPLRKYINLETLKNLYNKIRKGELKCS